MAQVIGSSFQVVSSPDLRTPRQVEAWTNLLAGTHDLSARKDALRLILTAVGRDAALLLDWQEGSTERVYPLQVAAHDGVVSLLYRAPERDGIHERSDVRALVPVAMEEPPDEELAGEDAVLAIIPSALNRLASAPYLTTGQRVDLAADLRIIAAEIAKPTTVRMSAGSVYATESGPETF